MRRLATIFSALALAATASAQSLDPSMIGRMAGISRMPMDGLAAWWGFDQVNASNIAGRVYGRDLTATKTNTLFGYAYGFGQFAGAQFSQVPGERLSIPSFADAQPGAFTVCAWVYRTGDNLPAADNYIVAKSDGLSAGKGWFLLDYMFGVSTSAGVYNYVYSTVSTMNEWTHWAGVYDSALVAGTTNAVRLYKNGIRVFSGRYGLPSYYMETNALDVTVANGTSASYPSYPGRIANVALYSRALTDAEIYELSQDGRP